MVTPTAALFSRPADLIRSASPRSPPVDSIDCIFFRGYNSLPWEVEFTDEFGLWWARLTEAEQVSVAASVRLLELRGPELGFPHSSAIAGETHAPKANRLYDEHLRQLRKVGLIDG